MTYDLKAARARKGWTQVETAHALKCSLRSIKGWEKDPSTIPALKIAGIRSIMTERKMK